MGKHCAGCNCCVPMCPYYKKKCPPNTEWYGFPRDKKLRKIWLVKLRRDEGKNFQITNNTRICSHHFVAFDKYPRNELGKIPRLKRTAVPSIFPWTTQKIEVVEKKSRLAKRNASKILAPLVSTCDTTAGTSSAEVAETELSGLNENDMEQHSYESAKWNEEKLELLNTLKDLRTQNENLRQQNETLLAQTKEYQDENMSLKAENPVFKGTFLKHEKQILRYENIRNDAKLVKFYTGFTNDSWFCGFLEYLHPKCKNLAYWKGKKTNTKNIKKAKTGLPSKLNARNMLFLVLLRIKVRLPIMEIGRMFGISEHSHKYFHNVDNIPFFELRELFPIPPIHVICASCPEQFAEYPDTTIIIDCCELRIQKPSNLTTQRDTFSNYKHYNTLKFLVGITPAGLVCFVSALFCGNTSDKQIIQGSKFIEMLCPGHSIMADKGFDILDMLPCEITLNVSPKFMKKRDGQMPLDDVLKTRKIASVRVHIERAIARIKTYRILSYMLPLSMRNSAEQIITVCAYLTNFKPALLKNKAATV